MSADAQRFWDDRYRRRDPSRPGRPYPPLVEALTGTAPGPALELGCGDGANAIWLAAQGWTVLAVDVSRVALDIAARHAEQAGVSGRIRWLRADLDEWTTRESFALVSALFLHSPLALDAPALLARAVARVRPGGTLLVVGHFTLPPWAWNPENTSGLPSASGLVDTLALHEPAWHVRTAEQVERAVTRPDGRASSVLDAVVHAVRDAAGPAPGLAA